MTKAIVKPGNWLLGALFAGMLLAFGFGFLTLAGGGIFIVALAIPIWLFLIYRARRSRAMKWIAATPIVIYGGFLIAGLFYQFI